MKNNISKITIKHYHNKYVKPDKNGFHPLYVKITFQRINNQIKSRITENNPISREREKLKLIKIIEDSFIINPEKFKLTECIFSYCNYCDYLRKASALSDKVIQFSHDVMQSKFTDQEKINILHYLNNH